MEMPDKIYLNKYMIRKGMMYPAEPPYDVLEEEYIRKDALLEWLEQELTLRRRWFERYEDGEDLHACNELTKIIEKINSI